MSLVAIITNEERDLLQGKTYDGIQYWNVQIKDINDNWIIGAEEINDCTMEHCMWVKDLPLTEYLPKPITPIF